MADPTPWDYAQARAVVKAWERLEIEAHRRDELVEAIAADRAELREHDATTIDLRAATLRACVGTDKERAEMRIAASALECGAAAIRGPKP